MPIRTAGYTRFIPVILYTALLFMFARYLPVWTKKAAAALTWVVYARLIMWAIGTAGFLTLGAVALHWPGLKRKVLFLAAAVIYLVPAVWLVLRLGGSVNEYVHFPEYAVLTLLWYYALRSRATGPKARTVALAAGISALTGLLEETSQLFIPLRVFDIQDVLLNLMGVILGLLLIWAFDGPRVSLVGRKDPAGLKVSGFNSFNS